MSNVKMKSYVDKCIIMCIWRHITFFYTHSQGLLSGLGQFLTIESQNQILKNDEKCFLSHVKGSFHS